MVRPSDPDRLLDAPDVLAWNARDDYMPYWAYLWPGAYLLAEAIAREPGIAGREALEIGCGLGLAGLVAMASGARVRFTDYDETPLQFVARSVAENGLDPSSYAIGRLDWREPPDERYALILGADVLYEHRLVTLVADLLARVLAPGGTALLAGPFRVSHEGVPPAMEARGLAVESGPIEATGELGAVRGTLFRVHRAGS